MTTQSSVLKQTDLNLITALLQGRDEIQAEDLTGGMFKQSLAFRNEKDKIHIFYVDRTDCANWIDGVLHLDGKIELGHNWYAAQDQMRELGGECNDPLKTFSDLVRHIRRFVKVMKAVLKAFTEREIDNVSTIRRCEKDLGIPVRNGIYETVHAISSYYASNSPETDREYERRMGIRKELFAILNEYS